MPTYAIDTSRRRCLAFNGRDLSPVSGTHRLGSPIPLPFGPVGDVEGMAEEDREGCPTPFSLFFFAVWPGLMVLQLGF